MTETNVISIASFALAALLPPLMVGVINRTKAFFAGRKGRPLLQVYYDLSKLLGRSTVYSRTTTWIFRAFPVVAMASVTAAASIVPFAGRPALLSFNGDLVLFAYWLGLMRFFTVLAALDTGSAFEGMGASREVQFGALAEPALFVALAALARETGRLSLSGIYGAVAAGIPWTGWTAMLLAGAAILVVFLAENSRIPVDDPETHLELTMIHEAMILDHSGPDLALILYSSAMKLWIMGALLTGIVMPINTGNAWFDLAAATAAMAALAVLVGVIESTRARLRLVRVPQMLVAAAAMAVVAMVLAVR